MDVSVIHGRTHSRLVNRRQGNSWTRNGSRRFHANHAMIMNEIRCILQVFRQGIDVQRLMEDVSKLRASGMVQGTVHLGQVS
jgi:division protein CdvB (Snf7/Vps24/ESCRT-III family)